MSRKLPTVTSIAILTVLVSSRPALSQCSFDVPQKASTMKQVLVRAYTECSAPNTVTVTGVPACSPPAPPSSFLFGPTGGCKLQVKSTVEIPCPNGAAVGCLNLTYRAKCQDVTDSGGMSISGSGWGLYGTLRLTQDDRSAGDVTVVDLPFAFSFEPASNGNLKLKSDIVTTHCPNFFTDCSYAFSPCANVELIDHRVVAPGGFTFATPGVSGQP